MKYLVEESKVIKFLVAWYSLIERFIDFILLAPL